MSETLKTCPFCGGEAELVTIGSRAYMVKCKICQIKTPRVTKAGTVVRIWNTRRPTEQIIEQLMNKFRKVNCDENLEWNRAIDKALEIVKGVTYGREYDIP